MPLHLYNTLTNKEEEFIPLVPGEVSLYTCGPTVYGRPHIGNYVSFLMADLLRRYLEMGHNLRVTHVKNITDVGHLVADADDGEDKIEKQAKQEQVDPLAIAEKYTDQYLKDEVLLHFIAPEHRPKATEYIKEMLDMIKILLNQDQAYTLDDGIYFDTSTFKEYGKLSGNTLDNIAAGARVAVNEGKRHPADFALWKICTGSNAHHLLRWSFESGERTHTEGEDSSAGFPGWHIECSAMSKALLGEHIDIHTGGEDNIFPHHECEIAQSESVLGDQKPFARFWLHRRRMNLKGEKMSKSLGNVLSIDDILERNYSPLDFRYYVLSVHYRTNLKFDWEGLEAARTARKRIAEWVSTYGDSQYDPADHLAQQYTTPEAQKIVEHEHAFRAAMDSDLNTPGAFAAVFDCMKYVHSLGTLPEDAVAAAHAFMFLIEQVFGCFTELEESIPEDILLLAKKRDEARAQKDFQTSDDIRDQLTAEGYEVRDTDTGTEVRRA